MLSLTRFFVQLNVLVDDGGNGVLCDFGLSRIRADVTSRASRVDADDIVGSLNWMAPERLLGGILKKPSDIYALGMTTYEVSIHGKYVANYDSDQWLEKIYTLQVPLGELKYGVFIQLVVMQDVRPERPEDEDAPKLSDAIWELAEQCWVKNAKKRPTANAASHIISRLLSSDKLTPSNDA